MKTIGRNYPEIAVSWMEEELNQKKRKPAAIVKQKTLKFLPIEMKEKFLG